MAICADTAKLKKNICSNAACHLMHTVSVSRTDHTAMPGVGSSTQRLPEAEDMQHVSSHQKISTSRGRHAVCF